MLLFVVLGAIIWKHVKWGKKSLILNLTVGRASLKVIEGKSTLKVIAGGEELTGNLEAKRPGNNENAKSFVGYRLIDP